MPVDVRYSKDTEIPVLRTAISILFYCAILFPICGAVLFAEDALGFWPFSSIKERYVAQVGNEFITKDDYAEAVNALHKSNRVGEELTKATSFDKQNNQNFLDELIDIKLMKIEAETLSLDKGPEFMSDMENYILNLSLERLRQEEIKSKIKVEDNEIEEYYIKQHRDEKAKSEVKKDIPEIPLRDKESIKNILMRKKTEEREREYFPLLREKASIKVDSIALSNLSADNPDSLGKPVAEVNSETILGKALFYEMRISKANDTEDGRRQVLDKLIFHKLLDQEAKRRGYSEEKELKEKINRYRESSLIKEFKIRVILPGIIVTEEEIKDYYEKNLEQYKKPDRVDLAVMLLAKREQAEEALEELRKGADFSYLARKDSIDSSGKKGGRVGWSSMDIFPAETKKALYEAKKGDFLGPFQIEGAYAVAEFHRLEKGGYRPLDDLKDDIDKIIGRQKFNTQLTEYLVQLRKTVPVKINEKELNLVNEGK